MARTRKPAAAPTINALTEKNMSLTFETAHAIVADAIKTGAGQGMGLSAVVVDRGGRIVASGRADNCGYINLAMAERKVCFGVQVVPT